jgi:TRAP-type C4-dicarboxylate transport system permease small subunit
MSLVAKILNRFILVVYDIIHNLSAAILALILCTVLAGIVSRYIFNRPFIWTEEICTFFMVWLAYLTAPLATISKEHVVADFFKSLLPKRLDAVLVVVIRLFEIFFLVFVARSCLHYIPNRTFATPVLHIPRVAFYAPVLGGTLIMLLSIVIHIVNDFVPGYNYFQQRKDEKDKEIARKEKEEEQQTIKNMETFMDEVEKAAREKGGEK